MAFLFEKYIPTQWINSSFVEIFNCDIDVRPSKRWFLHPIFSLKKREWLDAKRNEQWDPLWEAAWDIEGSIKVNSNIYSYTNQNNVYEFDWDNLSSMSNYGNTRVYSNQFKNEPINISYVWWGRYPNASTTYTVVAYTWATAEIEISWAPSSQVQNMVGKFIYITSGSWQRQIAQVDRVDVTWAPWSSLIYLDQEFNIAPSASDTFIVYNKLTDQVWFPQLRKWLSWNDINFLYSQDFDWYSHHWYVPNAYKIVRWDNRLFFLHQNRYSILPTDTRDYEQILLTKIIRLGTQNILNIDVYGWYLFVFFSDRIGIIRKVVVDQATQDFVYIYQDLLDLWLYSENSYLIQGNDLYIFANDNRLYSVSIDVWGNGEVVWDTTDQWVSMVNYFSQLSWWEVYFNYNSGVLYMHHKINNPDGTTIFKFNTTYQCWIVDEYSFAGNFYDKLYDIWPNRFIYKDNLFLTFWWTTDLWENIDQRIRIYWPVEPMMTLITLLQIKIRLWFDWTAMWWKVKLSIWWYRQYRQESDIKDLDIIDKINQYALWGGTMGSYVFGDPLMWWQPWFWELQDYFSEFLDIWFRVWKKWSHFVFEIQNDTPYQLYVAGIETQFNTENNFFIYNKWVL